MKRGTEGQGQKRKALFASGHSGLCSYLSQTWPEFDSGCAEIWVLLDGMQGEQKQISYLVSGSKRAKDKEEKLFIRTKFFDSSSTGNNNAIRKVLKNIDKYY